MIYTASRVVVATPQVAGATPKSEAAFAASGLLIHSIFFIGRVAKINVVSSLRLFVEKLPDGTWLDRSCIGETAE